METMLSGGLIRAVQGLAMAAPTLLVGLLIAGVLRYYVGAAGTRRLFGGENLWALPQAWLLGMLLPVCSIGVLPILRQMHRAGVRPGAMTAFALSAPLFNPLSLLYGLTLSRPLVIAAFAILSLVLVTLLGWLWDRWATGASGASGAAGAAGASGAAGATPLIDSPAMSRRLALLAEEEVVGIRRLRALSVFMSRELAGPSGGLTLIALGGLLVLGAILPHGALQSSVEQHDPWAPARMAVVAIPVYATPMLAMSQLGMMFQHANSPGAALALLLLGTGVNLGTLAWLGQQYGGKATGLWFSALLGCVLACAYGVDRPLIPAGVEPAGHTHAFDVYTNPLQSGQPASWAVAREAWGKSLGIPEWAGLSALAGVAGLGWLAGLGGGLRILGRGSRISSPETATTAPLLRTRWDRPVPPPVLGGTLLAGLVGLSVVACYAYYPPPQEALEELRIARVETLSGANSGQFEHALHWLPIWDEWSRRLEVGVFLRQGSVRPYQRMQGYIIRKKLELLEHALEETPADPAEIGEILKSIYASDQRWRDAFRS